MKTSELTGAALDWAVAQCEGGKVRYQTWFITYSEIRVLSDWDDALEYSPSTDWAQGGPIIEREHINTCSGYQWEASKDFDAIGGGSDTAVEHGPTLLIAAMRCRVASKLGDEVEVPKELT
jgi:hypothetical protein